MHLFARYILVAFLSQSHAKSPGIGDKAVEKLVDTLGRMWPLRHAGLDDTVLARPHIHTAQFGTSGMRLRGSVFSARPVIQGVQSWFSNVPLSSFILHCFRFESPYWPSLIIRSSPISRAQGDQNRGDTEHDELQQRIMDLELFEKQLANAPSEIENKIEQQLAAINDAAAASKAQAENATEEAQKAVEGLESARTEAARFDDGDEAPNRAFAAVAAVAMAANAVNAASEASALQVRAAAEAIMAIASFSERIHMALANGSPGKAARAVAERAERARVSAATQSKNMQADMDQIKEAEEAAEAARKAAFDVVYAAASESSAVQSISASTTIQPS